MPLEQTTDERRGLPSASSMNRVIRCPGSVLFEKTRLEQSESDVAASGTRIHRAMEEDDTSWLGEDEAAIAGKLKELEQDAIKAWVSERGVTGTVTFIREERFWIRDAALQPVASAKPDVVVISGASALVCNYKTGFKSSTEAAKSWQCRTEALSLLSEHPELQQIRVCILQHRFKSYATAADYTREDLERGMADLMQGLWRAKQPDAPRVPGIWCDYCKARPVCREFAAYCMVPLTHAGETAISIADAAEIERRRPATESFLEQNTSRLKGENAEALASVGFQSKPSDGTRTIPDASSTFKKLHTADLTTGPEFLSILTVPVAKLESLLSRKLKERNPKAKKAELEAAFTEIMGDSIVIRPQSPRLIDVKLPK